MMTNYPNAERKKKSRRHTKEERKNPISYRRQHKPSLLPRNYRPKDEHGSQLPIWRAFFILCFDDTIPSLCDLFAQGVEISGGAAAAGADVCEDAVGWFLCDRRVRKGGCGSFGFLGVFFFFFFFFFFV